MCHGSNRFYNPPFSERDFSPPASLAFSAPPAYLKKEYSLQVWYEGNRHYIHQSTDSCPLVTVRYAGTIRFFGY